MDHRSASNGRLRARARTLLPQVERRLRRTFGTVPRGVAPLGNKRDPVRELIFIQLTVRTPEATYLDTYARLRTVVGGEWARLRTLPDRSLLPALRSGGMGRVKLARLRGQLAALTQRFGRITLAPLRRMSDTEAEEVLCSLPGVGPKVARCVLMYSLDRDVFPVDSNCLRIFGRLGLLPRNLTLKASHDVVQDFVPPRLRRSLHVNLVRLGRSVCTRGKPHCALCPLLDLCPTGLMSARNRAEHDAGAS